MTTMTTTTRQSTNSHCARFFAFGCNRFQSPLQPWPFLQPRCNVWNEGQSVIASYVGTMLDQWMLLYLYLWFDDVRWFSQRLVVVIVDFFQKLMSHYSTVNLPACMIHYIWNLKPETPTKLLFQQLFIEKSCPKRSLTLGVILPVITKWKSRRDNEMRLYFVKEAFDLRPSQRAYVERPSTKQYTNQDRIKHYCV